MNDRALVPNDLTLAPLARHPLLLSAERGPRGAKLHVDECTHAHRRVFALGAHSALEGLGLGVELHRVDAEVPDGHAGDFRR